MPRNTKGDVSLYESAAMHSDALDATVGLATSSAFYSSRSESSADRRNIMGLDDTFSFGKYSSKRTLEYVIEHDMGYIDWLTENEVVYFDEEAYELIANIKYGE